jgi:phosphate-selective porin OprO/OprP
MFKRQWRRFVRLLFVGGVAAALVAAGPARADDKDDIQTLKQQLEAQKQQMEQQKKLLDDLQKKFGQISQPVLNQAGDLTTGLPAAPTAAAASDKATVESIIADYLKRQDEAKKAAEAAAKAQADEEGHKVGSDLKMSTFWNPLNGTTSATANKDFVSHIGVRFQYDSVWFTQNGNTRVGTNPIGDLQDGSFFRRVRPSWDGQAWEIIEWNVELALEQVTNDVINYDQVWVGIMNLPALGAIRIGHLKTPQGLEGDTTGSSKSMSFMERSMYTDAFYQNFCTGALLLNSVADQRATYSFAWYRQDNGQNGLNQYNNGADFGDGDYGYTGRITALPIWENDGRCFLHLGASYTYRVSERPNATAGNEGNEGNPRMVEYRARPQMRDAIGDYGGTAGNNATPIGLSGDSRRIVDTGALACNNNQVIGTEAFYVRGPLSFMAEYAWANAESARAVIGTPAGEVGINNTHLFKPLPNGASLGNPWFQGGYVQVGYFLTGENRTYDRRVGTVGGTYIASPYTPFWLTRGEDGRLLMGRGAWEVVARWNYLDLNSGDIAGGKSNALEVGLNWFLTTNLKFQFEYLWQDRYHLPPGTVPGDLQGFGIRTQFFF